jgi:competence protein ComEC
VTNALGRIWIAAAALAIGVIAGPSVAPAAAVALAATGVAALAARRRPLVAIGGLCLIAFASGVAIVAVRFAADSSLRHVAERVPSCRVDGRVAEQIGGLGTLIALDNIRCEGWHDLMRPGLVVADAAEVDPGAAISGSGWIVPLGDDPFDRQRMRLGAAARFDAVELRVGDIDSPIAAVAARVRHGLRDATSEIDGSTGGILRGLAVGDVTGIDPATEESLRRAGLAHLVAVSGSNVAIVLGAVAFACRRLGLRLRLGIAAAALFMFVAVVGSEPSVLRAALMGAIAVAAIAAGHKAEPLHALGLAVILLLCLRPGMVFSIGLHLSVAATAGIILWAGPIARRLRLPRVAAVPLAATLSAQVAVAPLLVLGFGEVSLVAPLANLIAFPAVPLGTILGLSSGVAGAIAPPVGAALARAAAPAGTWIFEVGKAFGGMHWASASVPEWSGVVMAGVVMAVAIPFFSSPPTPGVGTEEKN